MLEVITQSLSSIDRVITSAWALWQLQTDLPFSGDGLLGRRLEGEAMTKLSCLE